MKVQLQEHEELSWQRVAKVMDDSGEAHEVYFSWSNEYGYDIDGWHELPDWILDKFDGVEALAQYLDEHTFNEAYNKQEVSA